MSLTVGRIWVATVCAVQNSFIAAELALHARYAALRFADQVVGGLHALELGGDLDSLAGFVLRRSVL
jgi:hypothetical protein